MSEYKLLYNYSISFIYSYRIERVMTINVRRMSGTKNANMIYKGIIYAVDMHRKALKLVFKYMYVEGVS